MAVNPTRTPEQIWVDNTPPIKDHITQLIGELIVGIDGLDPRSVPIYATRASAVSGAGQLVAASALPTQTSRIFVQNGTSLEIRSRAATADDPLYTTPSPAWGVVQRQDAGVQRLATRETGVIPLANIGGTAQAATAALPTAYLDMGLTALAAGNLVRWTPSASNTATNPTLAVAGTTYTVRRTDGSPLPVAGLRAGREVVGRISGGNTIRLAGGVTEMEIVEATAGQTAQVRTAIDETGRVTLANVTQTGNTLFGDIPAALAALGVSTLTRIAITPISGNVGTEHVRLSIGGANSREVRTLDGLIMSAGELRPGVPLYADWDAGLVRWRVVSPALTRAEFAPVADRVNTVSAPALRRSTGADLAVHEQVDFAGGLHLPGLGGVSVQDNFRRAYRQNSAADAKAQRAVDQILARRGAYDAVQDFAIPNDGITNARTQIQAAVDFVSASAMTSGPGVIFFPPGVYRIEGGSVEPKSNVIIVGAGWGRSRFLPIAQHAAFRRDQNPAILERFSLFDVEIDCSSQSAAGAFIPAKGTYILRYRDCYFVRVYCHDSWATGLGNDFGIRAWYTDCLITGGGRGVPPGENAGGSSGIGLGTGIYPEENVIVSRCIAEDNYNNGIFAERQTAGAAMFASVGTIFSENICRRNKHGMTDAGMSGMIVANNQLYDNTSDGFALDNGTLSPSPTGPHPGWDTKLIGNQIFQNGGCGIKYSGALLQGVRGIQTSGNNIHRNGLDGISVAGRASVETPGFLFDGDSIQNNGRDGFRHDAGLIAGLSLKGAQILNNVGAAVRLNGTLRGGRIFGNDLWNLGGGAATPSITGTGALTDVDISENHGVGVSPMSLTGTQARVTTGRNPGL